MLCYRERDAGENKEKESHRRRSDKSSHTYKESKRAKERSRSGKRESRVRQVGNVGCTFVTWTWYLHFFVAIIEKYILIFFLCRCWRNSLPGLLIMFTHFFFSLNTPSILLDKQKVHLPILFWSPIPVEM